MSDTGLVWIREDFRIENNAALAYASQNHQNVINDEFYNILCRCIMCFQT